MQGFTMWSYQCPRIELGSALILTVIPTFSICLGHVENESIYVTTRISLDRRFGSNINLGEQYWLFSISGDEI